MKSLRSRGSELASTEEQLKVIGGCSAIKFADKLREIDLWPLRPNQIEIFQINMGKMCNQVCAHCHVDAGPDRREIMTRETLEQCLAAIRESGIKTIDITGGAPEMNPNFRWFVEEARKTGARVMVRCNLTIILSNPKYHDLPAFYRDHKVEVVSSLPHYSKLRTDRQRGDGVFDKSIRALQMLNDVGYGREGKGLTLNLVYNPAGAFLPGDQKGLEMEFKRKLKADFNIEFNNLYCITNMPISRYLEFLLSSGNYDSYMNLLVQNFNPAAAQGVMCRNTISVGWDGRLYDCDFNQMLDLTVEPSAPQHVRDFSLKALTSRQIVVNQHCYGCTAGSGSSCGGATA